MKVPDNLLFALFQEQDARIRKQLSEKSMEISTGRKHRNVSDEPSVTYNLLEIKKEISQLSQYSKNRLFSDTALSYIDASLGSIEERLNFLYGKAVQAKNQIVQSDQLVSIGEAFNASLRFLLDRVNDQLGGHYIFGGASLTTKPFNENTLEYVASAEPFRVWLSDNFLVDTFLRGDQTFGLNLALSRATFASPATNFSVAGTITISVGGSNLSINYTTTQTLTDLVNSINSSSTLIEARVSQNSDGTYSLMVMTRELGRTISISDTSGGDFDFGTVDFSQPNVLQAVSRVRDKLLSGLHTDESDLLLLQRAFDTVAYRRSQVGGVLSQVKSLQPTYENLTDALRKQKSDMEDADLSQSIMEYTRYRIAYEALMRIISDQKEMSILRFMR